MFSNLKPLAFVSLLVLLTFVGCIEENTTNDGDIDITDSENSELSENDTEDGDIEAELEFVEDEKEDGDIDTEIAEVEEEKEAESSEDSESDEMDTEQTETDEDQEADTDPETGEDQESDGDTTENCNPDPCSDLENMVCEPETGSCICKDGTCEIDGKCYADDCAKPDQTCLYCDIDKDSTDWSLRSAEYACRESQGVCDDAEYCDGVNKECPFDSKKVSECRSAAGICDAAEYCNGINNDCPTDGKLTTVCRNAAGSCDVAEYCTGSSNDCPTDKILSVGTECRSVAGECDVAEYCDGTNVDCPIDLKLSSESACREATGECDGTEYCDGTNNECPADAFKPSSAKCRESQGVCDEIEYCTGDSAECPFDAKSIDECRSAVGICDAIEYCDGTGNDCPTDGKLTTVCRNAAGSCDVAEYCTGSSNDCPTDKILSVGTECRSVAGECDVAEYCDGTNVDCPADVFEESGSVCRESGGICDEIEYCTGDSVECPSDAKSVEECRSAAGVCDTAENCDGVNNDCPADEKSTDECRAAIGACDAAEVCDGVSNDCPSDLRLSSESVCREAAGACDITEYCDGTNVDCPADVFEESGSVCRESGGICDEIEYCTGDSVECPSDAKSVEECRSAAGVCDTAENCDGVNNDCPADGKSTDECRAAVGACDAAEVCDGVSNDCPSDQFTSNGSLCDDGNNCTDNDTCENGVCSGSEYSCNDNGTCNTDNDVCECQEGYAGEYCDRCEIGYIGYPDCQRTLQLSAHSSHTCVLLSDGTVKCWGYNYYGQLGDGTTATRPIPVNVSVLQDTAIQIASGYYHTCVLYEGGVVNCWGGNNYGQLGDGTNISRLNAVQVIRLSQPVKSIAAGDRHTCVLREDEAVQCWGNNGIGQLGDGTTTDSYYPVTAIAPGSGTVQISTGSQHSCALYEGGTIKCWGENSEGQLGDGTETNRKTPVSVSGIEGAVAIALGGDHSCALFEDGTLKCWGYNYSGQLGDGTKSDRKTPVSVSGIEGAVAIALGYRHSCALLSDGTVKCWGYNYNGQLGDGTTTERTNQVSVSGIEGGAVAIDLGHEHSCALFDDGTIKCWGNGTSGQLGDGTTNPMMTPFDVYQMSNGVTAIATGDDHSCGIMEDGNIKCFGFDEYGRIGQRTIEDSWIPQTIVGLESNVSSVDCGGEHSCVVRDDQTIRCWGTNTYGQLGVGSSYGYNSTPQEISGVYIDVAKVVTGDYHTCALLSYGAVDCWGNNEKGQLGDGRTATVKYTPTQVTGFISGVADISAGTGHTCALLETGGVKCWGYNGSGELGDGTTTDKYTPTQVSGLSSGVADISTGYNHTCAVLSTGAVKCWGYNGSGQLGDGTTTHRNEPTQVTGLESGVLYVRTGENFTCALLATGAVKCWGKNFSYQLGNGTRTDSYTPIQVTGLESGVIDVQAGKDHACALMASGAMKCWGNSVYGKTGCGSSVKRIPVDVIWQ